jgi:ribosome biogenesis GTPase
MNDDGTGVIYEILERKNHLSRKAIKTRGASYRGERLEQVIASNIDNIFIIVSTLEPDFNNKTWIDFWSLVKARTSKQIL